MAQRLWVLIAWVLAIAVSYAVILGPPFFVVWWVTNG